MVNNNKDIKQQIKIKLFNKYEVIYHHIYY